MLKREGARQRGYTRRWELFRAEFLRENPLCTYCAQLGRATPATVVDHVVPHQGDMALFWQAGNHQALCASCHNSAKQREERGTPVSGCGLDGVPLSPTHHWTRGGGE